ncbi:MAG TPA: T9SS type A sorting domain-containing protein, partial [Ignavibacteriaceae bacterium]|nr:T9SS type A sorting domain-containing protein [Ignavibacteriaceae bacterium]
MNKNFQLYLIMITFFPVLSVFAQMGGGGGGFINPDSIQTVTKSGKAIVDTTTMMHPMYYLDENNDGTPDFMLNFGPWWYEPDSSEAIRPQDGDQITIEGGLVEETMMGYDMIIVYEINGEYWRDPFDSFWNFMGYYSHGGGGCGGSGFGWMFDSLQTVELSGTSLVDSTFMMAMYYLDTNNDNVPDYMLNFGPWWYEPESGAVRPENGDQITITGGAIEREYLPMVIVYEINGLQWIDSTLFCQNFGGNWIHRYMNDPVSFFTPFDNEDRMQINPDWWHMGGPGGGGMMADSMYCQIFETSYEQLPGLENQNVFAAYEVDMYLPNGMNGLHQGGGCGYGMQLNSEADYQLHYNDIQAEGNNIDESTIQVKYYDAQSSTWTSYPGAVADAQYNTVTFSSTLISNFIILTANLTTNIEPSNKYTPDEFTLEQNYPNPFNPSTLINFGLSKNENVTLNIYNVLGQKIETLINGNYSAGHHSVVFDAGAKGLSSGTYFYELIT